MKKAKAEKQLLKLLEKKGAITILQARIKTLMESNASSKDHLQTLQDMIALVTAFQDKHAKRLSKIKEGLKKENSEIFPKFGRFYATIKILGRDRMKTPKHRSFVSNQAAVKRLKIGKTVRYIPTASTIFVSTEFYRQPLSLKQIKELQERGNMGTMDKLMIKEIISESRDFIKSHGEILTKTEFK